VQNLTAVSDGRLMVTHAHILLPIKLHGKIGKLFQIWWRSVHK